MSTPRWALVTGVSSGGMGEGHVNAFLKRGINVVATTLDMNMILNLPIETEGHPAELAKVELNVTSKESIDSAVEEVRKITSGRLDFLLNNAGYGYYMPLLDVEIEKAKKQYDVNVWGLLAVTQAFFPLLRAAKGTVVNQASIAGLQSYNRPYMGVYSSSKAAVSSLSDCMRVELSPFDIKVVTLITGPVKTEFYTNKEGGRATRLPPNSAYEPIRQNIESLISNSFAGAKGHSRHTVTTTTVAVLLRSAWFRTRYIWRGYATIRVWLMFMLLPTWLLDRWSRNAGSLNHLKRILHSK